MKRIAAIMLICALCALGPAALAEPSPTPSSTLTDGAASSLIAFNSTGETVVRIQLRLRELGYFNYKATGNFQNMTVEAAKRFQQKQTDADGHAIIADGTVGAQSMGILFEHDAVRADIEAAIPIGSALSGTPAVTGELVDWSEVKTLLLVGKSYLVHDFNTGTTWNMTFIGGENHAEMECTSADDTYAYRNAFGDEFNYSKRPVVIEIDGRLIAASLQGYPHGNDEVSNNDMAGHACMFFNGSLSHVGNLPDVEHQALVYKAAGRS
jgi:peptidoglycan hydrolase-like protein with peptidoglycan-binding domain